MSSQNRNRIEAALEATGLLDKYKQVFNDTGVNDVQVSLCIKNPTYRMLHEVIESPDDYDLFVDAYTSREKFQSVRHTVDEEDDDADIDDYDDNNENDSDYDNKLSENLNLAELNNMNSVNSTSKSKSKSIPSEMTNSTRPVLRDIVYKEKSSKMNAKGPFATYGSPSSSSKPLNPTMKSIKGFTKFLTTLKRYRSSTTEENGSPLQLSLNLNHEDSSKMLRMKPFRHTMEPVQIIDIPLKSANSSNSLIFNREPLQEILSKVGRRPVALLSIAGPSRQGKSFILSYMVKYLKATSISSQNSHSQSQVATPPTPPTLATTTTTDWMGKSGFKKRQPLLEGFLWRSGVERETTGIWMWPEPFTLQAPDGSEFDVLLVDTQGVFDDYTDRKDWATIVGLSLLTSSCLIFNIMNNLQEDSLITLKDFMDFGLMAKTPTDGDGNGGSTEPGGDRKRVGDRDEKPFQKLLFLIRDWNTPDDYPFGAEGGADFLEANLNRQNTESGQLLRSQMKNCFEQLDCFLMPDPGSAVKRKTFDGSVGSMAPEFADNMEKFIEHIFHPSKFPPKIISGHPVTGDDLLLFFEQYVKIFNSDQMPSPQDLNEANVTICHQTILNKAFTIYEQGMQQLPDDDDDEDGDDGVKGQRSFVLDSELQAIHESASEQALQIFQTSRKMGSEVQIGKTKDILLQRIKDFYRLVSLENSKIQNDCVEEAVRRLEEYFISLMEEKIAQASALNGLDDFIQQDTFTAIFPECQAASLTYFQGYLKLNSLDLLPSAQTKFANVLKSLKEPMELQNKMKKSEAESKMREEISKLLGDYKAKMYTVLDQFKYWTPEQLQSDEGNVREIALSKFETIYSQSALYPQGAGLLNETIQKLFQEEMSNFVGLQNKNFLTSSSYLVSELASSYGRKMEDSARDGKLGTTAHDEEKQRCLRELKSSDDFHRLPPFEAGEFLSNLSTRINITWQNLVDKWFPRIRQKSIKNVKDQLTAFYDITTEAIGIGEGEGEAEQEDHLRSFKSSALEEFKEFTENIPLPAFGRLIGVGDNIEDDLQIEPLTPSKVLADFETEVDNLMEIIHENNKLRLESTQKNLSGFLSKAKSMFLEIVGKINQECFPKDKYQPIFQEAKERVMHYFQGQCNAYDNSFATDDQQPLDLSPAIFELDEFIENIAKFQTEDGCPSALEISGPSLKFSRELSTLENFQSSSSALSRSRIKEVRWIASQEIHMDANLCGEFWSGQNLVICAPQVIVAGNERLVVVSGENGKSAQVLQPPTPGTNEPGAPGPHGADGEPGESGGNVLILADEIWNGGSLRIISNGAIGGNGQPGGNGSNGMDGINGDQRFLMSLPDLELHFPSPAKFVDSKSNLKKGLEYLKGIATSHKTEVEELKCINSSSKCWTVETREGATFRYGFFQGGLKGLVRGRSFYVWFQGAPGTLGQLGGDGGLGGRGGSPGNPGTIKLPENKDSIKISKRPGAPGINGRDGLPGKNGLDGQQGTDYAIVDPYAGLYVPSNFISKKRFSGRLGIYFVKYRQRAEAAFCPHEKKYMTFIEIYSVKEGVKGHEGETTAQRPQRPQRVERKPMVLSRSKKQIKADKIQIRRYSINAYKPTPTVGRCGGFYVEESELRCCIENGFLGTSVIDTYAALLRDLHLGSSNETTAYIPSTAFSFTKGQWVQAQYLDDMVKNIRNSTTIELTTVATIVSAGNHWMLLVANAMTGLIQIADTLNGHCNDAKLQDGVSIFVNILNVFFGVKNWSMKYFPKVAKQTDSHSCGPASLYFLEHLYKNSEIQCYDPETYQYYRRTIVERILLSTDEGKKILQNKNDYTKYIENSTSTLI